MDCQGHLQKTYHRDESEGQLIVCKQFGSILAAIKQAHQIPSMVPSRFDGLAVSSQSVFLLTNYVRPSNLVATNVVREKKGSQRKGIPLPVRVPLD